MWNRCQTGQLENRVQPVAASGTLHSGDLNDELPANEKTVRENDANDQVSEEKTDSVGDENIADNDKNFVVSTDQPASYKNIEVLVNGETKIEGRLENKEVYVPFSFVRDYFEIEGKIVRGDFGKQFHVKHTSYEYFTPTTDKYDPQGSFLWFVNYNVEGRARVKCIAGVDGVPLSTQWGDEGYRYPIQIAQYGLSHFSMMVERPKGIIKLIDDCEKTGNQEWVADGNGASVKNVYDGQKRSRVMEFSTNGRDCYIGGGQHDCLHWGAYWKGNGSLKSTPLVKSLVSALWLVVQYFETYVLNV